MMFDNTEKANRFGCRFGCRLLVLLFLMTGQSGRAAAADEPTFEQARAAMKKAILFFQNEVSTKGGYLYAYSEDLSLRQGEEAATKYQIWVEPPGTPAVGEAMLKAYQKTGEPVAIEAAKKAAYALVAGQLQSGGWASLIDFEEPLKYQYRKSGMTRGRNRTTFDDNKSQSALRFLMLIDQELDFQDKQIHEAVVYAQDSFLKAQYPNGAWPQQYSRFPDPEKYPVIKASYPEKWSRTYPKQDYSKYYTFNDNTIADMIEVMFLAHHIYGEDRFRQAGIKGGEFILLAQMPEPQPAWAQQYNMKMHPAWARKFEPPAITGGESQGILKILMRLYIHTGEKKFLDPIPRAIRYLRSSELPGKKLARFYELKTNKPLYFDLDYNLTYSPDNIPTHYSFIVGSNLDSLERRYHSLSRISSQMRERLRYPHSEPRMSSSLRARALSAINTLDERGAWVTQGKIRTGRSSYRKTRVIETRTFMKNLNSLADYIAASRH